MASNVKNVCTKITKICQSFFKLETLRLGMLFDIFLLFQLMSLVISPGSAEADIG